MIYNFSIVPDWNCAKNASPAVFHCKVSVFLFILQNISCISLALPCIFLIPSSI